MKKDNTTNHIPDINIIDLEHDGNISEDSPVSEEDRTVEENMEEPTSKKGIRSFLNMHVLLLLVFVIFVVCIVIKFQNWGERIDISQIESDNSGTYHDVLDHFLPLMDADGHIVETGDVDTIVCFGNAPFADDRDSKDNLANLIAKETGATVYNCSVSNSYLASQWPFFDSDQAPMDAYCFYWLATYATTDGLIENYYKDAARILGNDTPAEADEVLELLDTIDFNEVDVITVMYDASDYLMGHGMYDDENPTNIQRFTGNLEAGIELFQNTFPHIRIIVMSPTFAYPIDENGEIITNEKGERVSSDMYVYNDMDVLSTYVIKEFASCSARNVTFVDHLYGTITEANADEYLEDHLHLNIDGRKLVTKRFMDALNRTNRK